MKKCIALVLCLTLALGLTACGEEKAKSADLSALYAQYQEFLPEMSVLDGDMMLNFFGIDAAVCNQAIAAITADGMRTDEIWLLETKDAETAKLLKELAENRIQAKVDETISYAPDQYAVVEKAQILTEGNYLALLVSPDVDAMAEQFRAAFH